MSQHELLTRVIGFLDRKRIAYMATGSIVSGLQGQPRATHDIDLVVAMPANAADDLFREFPSPDFYLSRDAVVDAIRNHSMFNLLWLTQGDKVDFWMLTDDPFDQSRFARKRQEHVLGLHLTISTPEDTILAKLRWDKLSGSSEKQFIDALRVYELQREQLDHAYLREWAQNLGVETRWLEIQDCADGA